MTKSYGNTSADDDPKRDELIPYSKQYGPTMNTAPNPKNGEPLEPGDRATFMQNVGRRTKAVRQLEHAGDDIHSNVTTDAGDDTLSTVNIDVERTPSPRSPERVCDPNTADDVEAVRRD